MTTFVIETFDRELEMAIWALKEDGIEIESTASKSGADVLRTITVCVKAGAALLAFASAILKLIKAKQAHKPKGTKTSIRTTEKYEVAFLDLVASYENTTQIDIQ